MLDKIAMWSSLCWIFGLIVLERFGIISGNWHSDLQDALLVIAAVSAAIAVYKLDGLGKEIQRLKGK
jgi:hypothetical protein